MNKLSAYGHSFCIKILYSLLNDKLFLQNISDIISPDYFDNPAHKWIVDSILKYFSQYHTYPTMEVLKVEMMKEKNEILKVSVKEELKQAYTSNEDDIEYVKEEFFNFLKSQRMKEAVLMSADIIEQDGQMEDVVRLVQNAFKASDNKDVGLVYTQDIEQRYREEEDIRIPFPWSQLNDITDGGLPEGSLMVLLGGTGSGKSTTACAIAINAAKLGFNVIYYTLELTDKYVGKKIDNILTGIELKSLKLNRKIVEKANEELAGQIVIKEFYPGRSSLDNIESHIRQLYNTLSFRPDLIVIDYPELLKIRRTRRDSNEETNDVYTDITGMAKEMKTRIICPSQVNRAGMKSDVVEHDGVSGTIGKLFIATFSLSISRKRKDKLSKTARFHVLKSRLGEDGMTYNVNMDLKTGKIDIVDEYDEELALEESQHEFKEKIKNKFMNINA